MVLLFVVSLFLQYARVFATPDVVSAAAAVKAGTVQGFEIDGDLDCMNAADNPGAIPDGPPPPGEADLVDGTFSDGDDWLDATGCQGVVDPATPPSSTILLDPISDTSDNVFIGGAKEDDTRTWGYTTQKPTPKDDLRHAMAYAKFVGSSAFFFAGATRIVNNGDTHVDFELNRNPFKTYSDGISKPDRSVGDVLVSLEFSNGGGVPIVTVYKVTAVQAFPTGELATFSADVATTAAVHSATNFVDLPDQGLGYAIPEFQFAETSIDLAALGIATACPGLSNAHIRTRAGGDVDSSQLKDNLPPFPIDLNNCGKLRIEKHAGSSTGPLQGGATFTIDPDPRPGFDPDIVTIVDNDTTNNASQAGDQDPTAGELEIDPAIPGTYEVCETVPPPGYKLPADPCQDVTIPNNQTGTVVFADPAEIVATTLTLVSASPPSGSFVAAGQSITIVVRETNTGESNLTAVNVTGTNSCTNWTASATKVGGGTFSGSLAPGEAVDFTCTFNAPTVDDFSWTALGHGTDELGNPAPATNEDESGRYDVLMPATTLTLQTAPPAKVYPGANITIVVRETNSGEGTITGVHVDGGGSCTTWTASTTKVGGGTFSGSLGEGEAVDFTCQFTAGTADITWSADGKGTDALDDPVPAAGEHQEGAIEVLNPATTLTLGTPNPPAQVHAGDSITIVVVETNTGDSTLTAVNVTGAATGGHCATFTAAATKNGGGTFTGTLEPGESVNFTCTFTAGTADITWSALGHGTDELGNPAPAAGEDEAGAIEVINPATTLTLGTPNPPAQVHAGDSITIVVVETNTGDSTLTSVNVTGAATGGHCATFTAAANKNAPDAAEAFSGTLEPGESVNFTCTFTAGTADITWSALGHGTDELGAAVPTTNEDEAGAIEVLNPATTLELVSEGPDPALEHGSVTIVVKETNTGDSTLTAVHVTALNASSQCTTWVAAANKNAPDAAEAFTGTLEPGESVNFTCSIADVGEDDVIWNGLGHGTDELGDPAPATNEDEAGSIHVVNPDIDVVKTAGASLEDQAADGTVYTTLDGSTVVYKYVVTTLDPDGLMDVTVVDDKCSPVTAVTSGGHNVGDDNDNDVLEPDEEWVFQCSTVLTIADDGIDVHNIALASGQPIVGDRVDEDDDADVHLRHPDAEIVKEVLDDDHLVQPGDLVEYELTIAVTDGPTDLTVTDDLPVGVKYVADSASDGGTLSDATSSGENGTLTWSLSDKSGTFTLSYTVEITATSGDLPNLATVCVPAFNDFDEDCDDDDENVAVPGITIVKDHDDTDDVVGPGQTVTYTLVVSVHDGPVTNAVISDPLPAGQSYVVGSQTSDPEATDFEFANGTLTWTYASLDGVAELTYQVTIDADAPTGSQTNTATVCADEVEECDEDDATVRVPALILVKTLTSGFSGGTDPVLGPLAEVGDVLTYTSEYTLTNGPVTGAVLWDVIPVGLEYVEDSAVPDASYDADTRTLTWSLGTLTESGSVSYQVEVVEAALDEEQPLRNVATIDSNETVPDDDDATVGVNPPPAAATPTPRITPPSTDAGEQARVQGSSSGFGLLLLVLLGVIGAIGLLTPVPARARNRRLRR